MEDETTEDNGVLVLQPALKEHSGRYECQGLDLETMASLVSDPQELLVNCEGRAGRGGDQAGMWEPAPPPQAA